MDVPPLADDLVRRVLGFLHVESGPPTLDLLDRLLTAYTRTVPWESAFRIVRRTGLDDTQACPRWPDIFWGDALARGGGGTCFESNYAFFSLLRALGYTGCLTVNNMRDDGGSYPESAVVPSIGCHSAIMLDIDGARWLADVGLPLYTGLPVVPGQVTHRTSPFHTYTVRPDGPTRYHIERDRHPAPNCFTLIDVPVDNTRYRARLTADYGDRGLFLDRVIVTKVVNGRQWRFGNEAPLHLEEFHDNARTDHLLPASLQGAAQAVGRHFNMDATVLHQALVIVS